MVKEKKSMQEFICCKSCGNDVIFSESKVTCVSCGEAIDIVNNVIQVLSDGYHDNFGQQWNRFSRVQLDSFNGSNESENRLFSQSGLSPDDLKGKYVLEVGAGNGRFTEIFLKYGAYVVAVDYSTAVEANYTNHARYVESGQLVLLRANLFNLPLKKGVFDVVFCYGVIQHTGNNKKALMCLSEMPALQRHLYVDIYARSFRHYNPMIYLIRAIFNAKQYHYNQIMPLVERFVSRVFPYQLKMLTFLHGKTGILKLSRCVVNRSPNSVYGINLFLDGKITSRELAYQWCLMDTVDAWAPKHDHPVSRKQWRNLLRGMSIMGVDVVMASTSGHGYTAVLKKQRMPE